MEEEGEKTGEWHSKVKTLLDSINKRLSEPARDLNKVRVYFCEETGSKVSADEYLKRQNDCYKFEQTAEDLIVTLKDKIDGDHSSFKIEFMPNQLKISFSTGKDKLFALDLDLCDEIDDKKCNYEIADGAVTVILRKKDTSKTWTSLEAKDAE